MVSPSSPGLYTHILLPFLSRLKGNYISYAHAFTSSLAWNKLNPSKQCNISWLASIGNSCNLRMSPKLPLVSTTMLSQAKKKSKVTQRRRSKRNREKIQGDTERIINQGDTEGEKSRWHSPRIFVNKYMSCIRVASPNRDRRPRYNTHRWCPFYF